MMGGGRVYWGKKEMDEGGCNGVVVIFGWSSISDNHLASFVDLYSSLRWNPLVCRADFLTAYEKFVFGLLSFANFERFHR